jgi:hypothetical protein
MSEDDIKTLDVDGLKELIIDCSLKDTVLKEKKRLMVKSLNEIIKKNESQLGLAKEILEAKDSELARRILRDVNLNN